MPDTIIINDSSCLIDLRKAGLLADVLRLPFRFRVALPLLEDELSDFSPSDWRRLESRGLRVVDLDGGQVVRAYALRHRHPALSVYDCFSLVLAQATPGAMLLAGDRQLRRRARADGLAAHGILWVSDQMERRQVVSAAALADALVRLQTDPLVVLPRNALGERIDRLRRRAHRE